MEKHANLVGWEDYKPSFKDSITYFNKAKIFTDKFYKEDVERIKNTDFLKLNRDFFFNEYVWVVYATGFSAKAVSKFIKRLFAEYGIYDDLAKRKFEEVWPKISKICNNKQKANAVYNMACLMDKEIGLAGAGWEKFRNEQLNKPEKLQRFPYIGKITCYHLARNIGLLDFVKPDLHLVRMAEHWGYDDCIKMCEDINSKLEEKMPLGIIDLYLWYGASAFGTNEIKKPGSR